MLETIRLLFDYTRWADARLLDAVSKLSPDQWTRDLGNSHKSVRDTAVHIAAAQWVWFSRWKGTSPSALWPAAEYPTQASLRERWEPQTRELAAFIGAQTEDSLLKPLAYKNLKGDPFSYPLGHQMLHAANHSTYHRGQVTTLLRQLGVPPVSTDLIVYYMEKAKSS